MRCSHVAGRLVPGLIVALSSLWCAITARAAERAYDIHDFLWTGGAGVKAQAEDKSRRELAEDVISLLRDTVEPDAWKKGRATIRERDGGLIVNAPDAMHAEIVSLFE